MTEKMNPNDGDAVLPSNMGGASEAISKGMETVFRKEQARREKEDLVVNVEVVGNEEEAETLKERVDRITQELLDEHQDNGEHPPMVGFDESARRLAAEAGMDVYNPLQWAILMATITYMAEHYDSNTLVYGHPGAPRFEDSVSETQPVK